MSLPDSRPMIIASLMTFAFGSYPSGLHTVMCVPSLAATCTSEWQVLFPSPTYTSFRPFTESHFSESVKKSASAWQGCM